jgi:hypothetical protein
MVDHAESIANRRAWVRKPCPTRHRLAVYRRGVRAENLAFRWTRCNDLCDGGFSFYCQSPPDSADLVLDLSDRDGAGFVLARVCNMRHNGDGEYIVGCRFVRRLD